MGIKNPFRVPEVHEAHVTCWLLKDIFWSLKLISLATAMIVPTVFFTIYLLVKEKKHRQINFILSSWVFMNIFWMIHEFYNFSFWPIYIFMVAGLTVIFKSLLK
jgi:hypothetical protein